MANPRPKAPVLLGGEDAARTADTLGISWPDSGPGATYQVRLTSRAKETIFSTELLSLYLDNLTPNDIQTLALRVLREGAASEWSEPLITITRPPTPVRASFAVEKSTNGKSVDIAWHIDPAGVVNGTLLNVEIGVGLENKSIVRADTVRYPLKSNSKFPRIEGTQRYAIRLVGRADVLASKENVSDWSGSHEVSFGSSSGISHQSRNSVESTTVIVPILSGLANQYPDWWPFYGRR